MYKLTLLLLFLSVNSLLSQQKDYEIFNTSINSKYAEIGVTYLNNNNVIFASSKKNDLKRKNNNGQLFLELYEGIVSDNGDIIKTRKFTNELKNRFFESDISFTPDFKTIYFTWNNFYDTHKRKDSAKWKTLYLFKASVDEDFNISNITPLPFNSKKYSVRSPEVSKDGKQLFFFFYLAGGYGDFDIYVVDILSNGGHSWPKNLGPAVNTKKAELYPFVDQNNNLYFSSYGHKGMGSLDVFKSEFINGSFQPVENLPFPINSKFDDFALVFNDSSSSGFFTSNRKKGKGDVDIYALNIITKK